MRESGDKFQIGQGYEVQAMKTNNENLVRCPVCRAEWAGEELDPSATGCPECGAKAPPQRVADDVTLTLNWQDLRILCNWSGCWCQIALANKPVAFKHLESIFKQIEKVRPPGSAGMFPE